MVSRSPAGLPVKHWRAQLQLSQTGPARCCWHRALRRRMTTSLDPRETAQTKCLLRRRMSDITLLLRAMRKTKKTPKKIESFHPLLFLRAEREQNCKGKATKDCWTLPGAVGKPVEVALQSTLGFRMWWHAARQHPAWSAASGAERRCGSVRHMALSCAVTELRWKNNADFLEDCQKQHRIRGGVLPPQRNNLMSHS